MNQFTRIYSTISKSIGIGVFGSNFGTGLYTARNVMYDRDYVPIPTYGCISLFKGLTSSIIWPIYPVYYYYDNNDTNKGIIDLMMVSLCPVYKSSMKFGKYYKKPEQFEFIKESK